MSEQIEQPESNPEKLKANSDYGSDDFKRAVGEIFGGIVSEAEKRSPAPKESSTDEDSFRKLIHSVLDEREQSSKSANENESLRKELEELKETVKKQSKRFFSIFD